MHHGRSLNRVGVFGTSCGVVPAVAATYVLCTRSYQGAPNETPIPDNGRHSKGCSTVIPSLDWLQICPAVDILLRRRDLLNVCWFSVVIGLVSDAFPTVGESNFVLRGCSVGRWCTTVPRARRRIRSKADHTQLVLILDNTNLSRTERWPKGRPGAVTSSTRFVRKVSCIGEIAMLETEQRRGRRE